MSLSPVFVAAVLALLALLRLAFGAAHGAAYLLFARSFRRFGELTVARAGAALAHASLALPAAGVVFALVSAITMYGEMPPGGLRRVVEIPMMVVAFAAIELLPAAALLALLAALHVLAQRRAR